MKQIALAPFEIPHKVNKLADRVGDATLKYMMESMTQGARSMDQRDRKVFQNNGSFKGQKKINIGMFYLTAEADIRWNNVKDSLLGHDLTWNRFLDELRAKFIQFGPIHLGPICSPIHFGFKLQPENFDVIKLI